MASSDRGRPVRAMTAEQAQAGEQAVAGGGPVEEDQVAGLLAAQGGGRRPAWPPARSGRRRRSARPRIPWWSMAWRKPRLVITVVTTVPVGRPPWSRASRAAMARITSPSTRAPCSSTASRRSASPSWARPTGGPAAGQGGPDVLGVGGADAGVDVVAVGVGGHGGHLGAGPAVGLGGDLGGGRRWRSRPPPRGRRGRGCPPAGGPGRPRRRRRRCGRRPPTLGADRAGGAVVGGGHGGLDALLDRVGELEALGAEELDAVVGHGVVGGGDHRPGGGAVVAGQEGDRRGRHHPGGEHVTAGAEDARDQGALQQGARGPGVAADDHGRPGRPGRTGRWPGR